MRIDLLWDAEKTYDVVFESAVDRIVQIEVLRFAVALNFVEIDQFPLQPLGADRFLVEVTR